MSIIHLQYYRKSNPGKAKNGPIFRKDAKSKLRHYRERIRSITYGSDPLEPAGPKASNVSSMPPRIEVDCSQAGWVARLEANVRTGREADLINFDLTLHGEFCVQLSNR